MQLDEIEIWAPHASSVWRQTPTTTETLKVVSERFRLRVVGGRKVWIWIAVPLYPYSGWKME
jgi:hypothetical protein